MKTNAIKAMTGMMSLTLLINAQYIFAAENFGRLFTTSANRAELDYIRQTQKLNNVVPMPVSDESSIPRLVVLPDAISMQGYVKRTDGKKSTVWVNNQAVQENESLPNVQVGKLPKNGNQVPLKLPANGKNFSLKAGQVYSPADNSISEARPYTAQDAVTRTGRIGDDDITNSNEK